ncbi:MAG: YfhO family protein [Prevotellaceae bacterium]|jgi:hypothetical protein|nr:YfhO family protein [Prevotellaceae bacterium]
MQIGNFGSAFELIAAINIAYVAVEYAKDYTNVLAHKVFKLVDKIEKRFASIELIFENRKSLESITELKVNEANLIAEVEKCKVEQEKLQNTVFEKKKELKESIDHKCHFRAFSNQCLWSFLFSVSALFCIGMENDFHRTIPSFLFFLTIITIFYFVFGWFFGEKNNKFCKLVFSSLFWVIVIFFISFVISFILGFCFKNLWIDFLYNYKICIIPFFALTPFLNFILYFIVSINRINLIKNSLEKEASTLCTDCRDWGDRAGKLIDAHALCLNEIIQEG